VKVSKGLRVAAPDTSNQHRSATGDDFDDFESVTGLESALGKFGRGDGFAIVFDHDAPREEVLGN
jgi:hypothetical protein